MSIFTPWLVLLLSLTGATFLIGLGVAFLWRRFRGRRGVPLKGALLTTLAALPLHLLLVLPLGLSLLASSLGIIRTRHDEAGYRGPVFGEKGRWIPQERGALRPLPSGSDRSSYAVHIRRSGGPDLRAFRIPASSSPRARVVLVHGLFRGALELEPVARMFHDLGAEVLLLELRNHGGSERGPFGAGATEASDVRAAVASLEPLEEDPPLVLFGVSLGAAACLLAAPEIESLDALVVDSPLVDPARTARRMLSARDRLGMPSWSADLTLWFWQRLAGVSLDRVRPLEALEELDPGVDLLVVAGGRDALVTAEDVERLRATAGSRNVEVWSLPDVRHGKAWRDAPEAYRRHLERLLAGL